MALLNTSQQSYYQGTDLGNYQFVSLKDIINQFMIVYVGEDKIISKVKRMDVAFYAQRALAELSFDTFKSCKTQEIVVPASLQMLLPHDYVNYSRIMWSDSSGIKHPMYPTRDTQNPFSIQQDVDGVYVFESEVDLGVVEFGSTKSGYPVSPWYASALGTTADTYSSSAVLPGVANVFKFSHTFHNAYTKTRSRLYNLYQEIDVSQISSIELAATGIAAQTETGVTGGTLRIGFLATAPDNSTLAYIPQGNQASNNYTQNENPAWIKTLDNLDAYLEWTNSDAVSIEKSLIETNAVDVSSYSTVWLVVTSVVDYSIASTTTTTENTIGPITITGTSINPSLSTLKPGSSTTWENYKSNTPSENNNDDYEDNTYWPANGERYGLDPSHAQTNGSYYIDCMAGKIHFSSNISGKTVILDYISDSLGTEGEMQVHKFAEEAMYKWITYAIISGKLNVPEYLVARTKKERFAETRKAKLRLSNIKR